MLRLHCVITKVHKNFIELLVVLQVVSVDFVNLIRPHAGWQLTHLIAQSFQSILNRLVYIDLEWRLLYLINDGPNFLDLLPHLEQIYLVLLKIVQVVRVAQFHI